MFSAFAADSDFNWWWLLAIPVVLGLLFAVYRVMTRVTWLQNRKLTVCIGLSVVAHALLLTGLYMAKLFDVPRLAGDGSIRVTFDDPTDDIPIASQTPEPLASNETSFQPATTFEQPTFEQPSFETPAFESQQSAPPSFETPEFGTADSTQPAFDEPTFVTPDPTTADADSEPSFPLNDAPPATQNADPTNTLAETTTPETPQNESPQFDAPEFPAPAPEFPAPDANTSEAPEFTIPAVDQPFMATDAVQTPDPSILKPTTSEQAVQSQIDPWQARTENAAPQFGRSTSDTTDLVPIQNVPPSAASNVNRYQLRSAPDRMEQVRKRGGDADTEAAVVAAQRWLAANQESDGHWDASRHQAGQERAVDGHFRDGAGREADTAITGLALLCLLGNGNTHQSGDYRGNVAKGLEYLMGQQSEDGSLAGNSLYYARTYCHGIATLALSEAYGMTNDDSLRPFVQRAIAFTLRTQQGITGGWRYRPGQTGDTSQFGWQVMALVSADQAGIPLAPEDRHLLTTFLRTVSTGQFGGLATYQPALSPYQPTQAPTRTMTAEALVCRVFLDQTADQRRLAEAADFIAMQPPSSGPMNLYYWYYGTIAMYQYGGQHWDDWNEGIKQRLLGTQQSSGNLAGSWDPNTVWGCYGGRVYSTAMAAMCLEVYYRYLPLISEHRVANRR